MGYIFLNCLLEIYRSEKMIYFIEITLFCPQECYDKTVLLKILVIGHQEIKSLLL